MTSTLYMTKGLPASGKSTWARGRVKALDGKGIVRINKDTLRDMLHEGHHSRGNENQILRVRDAIVSDALTHGQDVIVDDTNLAPKHEARLRQLAQQHGAQFHIQDFTDVSLDECLKRNVKRPEAVPADVILSMHRKFIATEPEPYPVDWELPWCIVVDIDGTLALMGDRNPYDASTCEQDEVNDAVLSVVGGWHDTGGHTVLLSGRSAQWRAETERWLTNEAVIRLGSDRVHGPYMRPEGDNRKDSVLKRELFDKYVRGKFNVRFVLDDRTQVVNLWRSMGLTCFQVAEGNF